MSAHSLSTSSISHQPSYVTHLCGTYNKSPTLLYLMLSMSEYTFPSALFTTIWLHISIRAMQIIVIKQPPSNTIFPIFFINIALIDYCSNICIIKYIPVIDKALFSIFISCCLLLAVLLFEEFNRWLISLLCSKFHIVPSSSVYVWNNALQFIIIAHRCKKIASIIVSKIETSLQI